MTENVFIRQAVLDDAANLVVLKQQVWIATYAVEGIRDEFSHYLLNEFTLPHEMATLEDPKKVTLVAEINHHITGCCVINRIATLPIPPHELLPEISVLYVLERFTGIGIGRLLLDKAMDLLEGKPAFLTVYHENKKALGFYEKFGFRHIGETYFTMGVNKYQNKVLLFNRSL